MSARTFRGSAPALAVAVMVAGCISLSLSTTALAQSAFVRGDANASGDVELADPYIVLNYLNGAGDLPCEDAADANDDGMIGYGDALALLGHLFGGTYQLPEPFPAAGFDATPDGLSCALAGPSSPPDPLVAVRDEVVMARFPLDAVLQKLIDTGNHTHGSDPLQFYQTWWGTFADQCDLLLNGFETTCSDAELQLQFNDPFSTPDVNPDSYLPVALFNRFDLAPADGAHCGQYRVVYGKRSGLTDPFDRNMLIFEAQLPNPTPGDVQGCGPFVQRWQDAANAATLNKRADILEGMFFVENYVPGFPAALNAANFRVGAGQVGTNTRLAEADDWVLRQFRLTTVCIGDTGICTEYLFQTPLDNVAAPALYAPATTALASAFQSSFLAFVPQLASGIDTPLPIAEAYRGPSSRANDDHDLALQVAPTSGFALAIEGALAAIPGSTLTASNVVDRANATTCAGCHNLIAGKDLGAGLTAASSLGFQHVDEHGTFSNGLTTEMLPQRAQVVSDYLSNL